MLTRLLQRLPGFRTPAKRALVLAGGGVVGGMYEVGALAALEEALPDFRANEFDLYVGSSAGAVVATLMANQVRPLDLYAILDEERVGAALGEGAGVVERRLDHGVHAARPARAAGQRAQMDHADDRCGDAEDGIEAHARVALARAAGAGGATARKHDKHMARG